VIGFGRRLEASWCRLWFGAQAIKSTLWKPTTNSMSLVLSSFICTMNANIISTAINPINTNAIIIIIDPTNMDAIVLSSRD